MGADRRVVVTGADGPVAAAVQKALRGLDFEVTALRRGDDLVEPIRGAHAVVVLDAVRALGAPADYELALGAVGQAVRESPVARVVSVTLCQAHERLRKRFAETAEETERDFAAVGIELVRIRFATVVGTLEADGPIDDVLVARGKRVWAPKPGTQQVRPMLVDDLAEAVAVATRDGGPETMVLAEGPDQMSVDDLLRKVNEPGVKIRHFGALRRALSLFAAERAARALPSSDLLLNDGPAPDRVLGVDLAAVDDVWSPAGVRERRQRRRRAEHVRRYRATEWSSLLAVLFGFVGGCACIVGAVDLFTLPTLGARLVSFMILLAGLFVFAGGFSLWTSWAARYALAFMAGAVALMLLTLLLLAILINGGDSWLWPLWLTLAIGVAYGCVLLWQRGRLGVRDFMRTAMKVSGSVIAAGVGVTLIQFLYSTVYAPTTSAPLLNAEVSLDPQPGVRGMTRVDVTVELHNQSKGAVNVLGAVYGVRGAELRPTAVALGRRREAPGIGWFEPLRNARPIGAPVVRKGAELLERGALLPTGAYFEPDERLERRFVTYVPSNFDVASLRIDVAMARRRFRSFGFDTFDLRDTREGPVAISLYRIDDPSWLHQLIRGPRYLHVMHALGHSPPWRCGTGQLAAYIDDTLPSDVRNGACADFERRMADHYGVTHTTASAEVQVAGTPTGER